MNSAPFILAQIMEERKRQNKKWGNQIHDPFKWLCILGEEKGEADKAALEFNIKQFRIELIHTAAVAVQIIEAIDSEKTVLQEGFL